MRLPLFILLFLMSISVFSHKEEKHSGLKSEGLTTDELLELKTVYDNKIEPIFSKACIDCHGQPKSLPWYYKLPLVSYYMDSDMSEAKTHLDISDGFPFNGHSTPFEDLKAIAKAIDENEMPPLRYKIMHSGAWLTDEEKNEIIKWTNSFSKTITKEKE